MKFIGIDFSINYPGVCIANQTFTEFEWIACINTDIPKKYRALLEDAMIQYPKLKFLFVDGKQKKTDTYHVTERNKLRNQIEVVETLVEALVAKLNGEQAAIAIEGLSFGSPGNSLIDLAHATGILKTHIYHSNFMQDSSLFFVFSPSELKNALGAKGNANKIEIFNTFLRDPKIPELRDSALFKFVTANKDELFNGKVVKSPFMDMIDSTLGVIKLKNSLS